MAAVRGVLFDADGVLQHPKAGWVDRLSRFDAGDPEGFLLDLWAAERPALEGRETLRDSVARLLEHRGLNPAEAEAVCALWDNIEIDPGAFEVVADVRAAGVPCHLATNQQSYRRDLMLDLGYADRFDRSFYSCDVGAAKPDPDYFRAVVEALEEEPADVVFVDDRPDNVEAAAGIGLVARIHDPSDGSEGLRALLRHLGVPGA